MKISRFQIPVIYLSALFLLMMAVTPAAWGADEKTAPDKAAGQGGETPDPDAVAAAKQILAAKGTLKQMKKPASPPWRSNGAPEPSARNFLMG